MGFDLFLAAVSIVAASIATWALLRLFPSSDVRQSIPLRPDAVSTDTADDGRNSPEQSEGDSTADAHVGTRLAIALILTIPTLVVTSLTLGGIDVPAWLSNPWLHAIVITPVMFYCAAPIHHRGMPALQRRHPNGDSLVSLGMAIIYAYSLLLCVVSWIFPVGSRDPYFAFVGVVATLSLADTLVRRRLAAQSQEENGKTQERNAEELLFHAAVGHEIRARVLQITTSVTMVVAVWTCALWLAFGVQPKPAIAMLLGATVLSVAGLILQAYDRLPENDLPASEPPASGR